MYEINDKAKSCKKKPLQADFEPMRIPKEAQYIGQFVIGGSSGPGEGLLANSWAGDTAQGGEYLPANLFQYLMDKTDFVRPTLQESTLPPSLNLGASLSA